MFFPEAANFLSAKLLNPTSEAKIIGASIDSRTLQPQNLFVALRGTQSDGHQFLDSAFKKGASGALIDESFAGRLDPAVSSQWKNLIVAADTAEAFLRLAGFYRSQFSLRAAAAVVGSVGKTSTKEFLAYLLRGQYSTLSTQGNLNNHLGLPLTLFGLRPDHQVCVCELGTNRLGDVRQLSQVLKPDVGLLTCVAPEHLEGFGSMDQVYEGEMELFECLPSGARAVIPDNDDILFQKAKRFPLKWVTVGEKEKSDYRISQVRTHQGKVHFKVNEWEFCFPSSAAFLARNAAMAVAAAEICGLDLNKVPKDWGNFTLPGGRFQIHELPSGATAIFDGYNASPLSFEAALQSFEEIPADGRKMLVFSDMLELGGEEKKYHEELGRRIARAGLDLVIAYGSRARWALEAAREVKPNIAAYWVTDSHSAAAQLGRLQKGDQVLLKASRGMRIEEVLGRLTQSAETVCH